MRLEELEGEFVDMIMEDEANVSLRCLRNRKDC